MPIRNTDLTDDERRAYAALARAAARLLEAQRRAAELREGIHLIHDAEPTDREREAVSQ